MSDFVSSLIAKASIEKFPVSTSKKPLHYIVAYIHLEGLTHDATGDIYPSPNYILPYWCWRWLGLQGPLGCLGREHAPQRHPKWKRLQNLYTLLRV
ncbi:MAG: hypothetical protein OXE41_05985 [Gammaproteobacteria bacterium]|nr:hypothetical protein [Gammaproteobacteria bacterium]MCY4219060.1 hypothetical protein [Gammaproteobacteria bacterium]MCY4274928.1 hypothetical protein [Gammaproteobacteria bacterium]